MREAPSHAGEGVAGTWARLCEWARSEVCIPPSLQCSRAADSVPGG